MDNSRTQTVYSRGIYHGLPTYPPSHKNLTAIITGANGISGTYMLRALALSPTRWSKIYCLSRRPPLIPNGLPENAEHIAVDFLASEQEIAKTLRGRGVDRVDYVFFFSYVQARPKEGEGLWSDAEEMCRVNVALLRNFCLALPLANLHPTRILLQTGAKNYGVHLGPTAVPQEETAPRVLLEPNFYYPQEDFLASFCTSHNLSYNIVMPSYILGAVPDAAMNVVYPLGIYASVCKHLGEPLVFPADLQSWEATHVGSTSMLNGLFEEWVVLSGEETKGEKFNIADSSPFTWGGFWGKFAGWYEVEYERPSGDDSVYKEVRSKYDPPPRGFGPPKTYRFRFTLASWAHDPKVQSAWSDLITMHNLKASKLQDMDIDRIFGFTDSSLMGGTIDMSMNKARKLGWHGFVDTNESFKEVLGEFADLGMLPPLDR